MQVEQQEQLLAPHRTHNASVQPVKAKIIITLSAQIVIIRALLVKMRNNNSLFLLLDNIRHLLILILRI